MLLAIILASLFALKIEEAKLYHFESDNRRFGKLRAVKQTGTRSPEKIEES
jgi:hypothetical protein